MASLYSQLCETDLSGTLAFFDTDQDGQVTRAELTQVLREFSSPEQAESLASQLLRGQASVKTAQLLDNFEVQFKESSVNAPGGQRQTPAWAKALLDTVSKQCAARRSSSLELFRSFDKDGDGFISFSEFQQAMLQLGGHATSSQDQAERVSQMLLDLAAWVDRNDSGTINYMEFCSAFRIGVHERQSEAVSRGTNLIDQIMEQLCWLLHAHHWSLKRAFDYFDANGDGVLSPEEFRTAVQSLSSMEALDSFRPLDRDALRTCASITWTLYPSTAYGEDDMVLDVKLWAERRACSMGLHFPSCEGSCVPARRVAVLSA